MARIVVTGTNGTVAPVLAAHLRESGHEVIPWNRAEVPADDADARRAFVLGTAPDWFFHIATGAPEWAEAVAALSREAGARFVFTSSVSVFTGRQRAPIAPDAEPDAEDDYGRYKIECERRVRAANPDAIVARIGWQIGSARGSNNMLDHLVRTAERDGRIEASVNWYQACSFLEDTAEALHRLAQTFPAGTYHLDGNPGLHFYDVVRGLDRLHDAGWEVVPVESPRLDNRMADDRIATAPITARLGL